MKRYTDFINESIRDKMVSKELTPTAEMVYNAVKDIESLGYKVNGLKNNQGRYEFGFRDETEENNDRYINVIYQDKEESKKIYTDEAINNMLLGWVISIYEGFTRSYSIENVNVQTWEEALLDIIYGLYPNMDDTIKETKKIIKDKEQLLINLEKRNKILNDN